MKTFFFHWTPGKSASNWMRGIFYALLLCSWVGCASIGNTPFPGANLVRTYTVPEFEAALMAEKKAFMSQLQDSLEEDRGDLSIIRLREFPTIEEWRSLKRELEPGDKIQEYRHRDFGQTYDGPPESLRRAFSVMRDGRILRTIEIPFSAMEANF